MITTLLVANRGEIARRIFRTARQMGLATVAVYSDADAQAPHVREADQAVRLGPAAARESYLNVAAVLEAARASGADAIHPGYGFLSENADFAEAVMGAGLTWVGPPPSAIRAMGLKDAAKALMIQAGVPVTPGYHGEDQDPAHLAAQAEQIGYILAEAKARQAATFEPSAVAEAAWVQKIIDSAIMRQQFLEECTPGYYNNEGKPSDRAAQNNPFGGGPNAYFAILKQWREDGSLAGLELS